jgi:hypothetical protein
MIASQPITDRFAEKNRGAPSHRDNYSATFNSAISRCFLRRSGLIPIRYLFFAD